VHQLTIEDDNKSVATTDYPNFDDAHRALLKYVVRADYYLRPVQTTAAHTSYELLRLADLDDPTPTRHPRITGSATIKELPDTELPLSVSCFAACDVQHWIADHAGTWLHGSATDPGYRYPMAVLTMAHGEARYLLRAGTLLPEAARLAGVEDSACPDQPALEALRHKVISSDTNPDNPSAIADAVQQLLPAGTGDHQSAALVWYYALIRWGVSAP
jgi:hypothetical protein